MAHDTLTYAKSGVDYNTVDGFKVEAQKRARQTDHALEAPFKVVPESRGESAFLIEHPHFYLAHVEEGLGTKNLIADMLTKDDGFHTVLYDGLAKDTVAMIVNDLSTLGARPLSVAMHLAVSSGDWFKNQDRYKDLLKGWQEACEIAGCAWGGGETPVLKDIIVPGTCLLSGSALGIIDNKSQRIVPEHIRPGDAIVMVESSGVHANGLTLARTVAMQLGDGLRTLMRDNTMFGITLLQPTIIYTPLVTECLKRGVDIHYAVHITGHGWRKLMRAPQPLRYVIQRLPRQLPVFRYIQDHGPVDEVEMYKTFNMGAGFALYVPPADVPRVLEIAEELNAGMREYDNPLCAFEAGYIEEGAHEVYIKPRNITLPAKDLAIR